jgi:hypothetical protein
MSSKKLNIFYSVHGDLDLLDIIILTRAIRLTVMEKQREYANRDEENILSVLAKLLVVFLSLVMAIGCRKLTKRHMTRRKR